jgi:Mce-associated membrane protein
MSDDVTPTDEDENESGEGEAGPTRPRPKPASAASRARRIGGLPAAAPTASESPAQPAVSSGQRRAVPEPKAPKAPKAKEPNAPKAPRTPRALRSLDGVPEPDSIALWIPSIVLSAAAVVMVVLIAVAGHGVYYGKSATSNSQRTAFSEEVLAAAKTCMAAINTYDYRRIDVAESAALACTTGKFTASLKKVFDTTIKPKAPAVKNIQTAKVNRAGIQSVSSDGKQVNVLLFGQLSVTNVSQTTPRIDVFGTVVTLDKVGSKWLIAKYESDVGVAGG